MRIFRRIQHQLFLNFMLYDFYCKIYEIVYIHNSLCHITPSDVHKTYVVFQASYEKKCPLMHWKKAVWYKKEHRARSYPDDGTKIKCHKKVCQWRDQFSQPWQMRYEINIRLHRYTSLYGLNMGNCLRVRQ